jgi:hypothetical protein
MASRDRNVEISVARYRHMNAEHVISRSMSPFSTSDRGQHPMTLLLHDQTLKNPHYRSQVVMAFSMHGGTRLQADSFKRSSRNHLDPLTSRRVCFTIRYATLERTPVRLARRYGLVRHATARLELGTGLFAYVPLECASVVIIWQPRLTDTVNPFSRRQVLAIGRLGIVQPVDASAL